MIREDRLRLHELGTPRCLVPLRATGPVGCRAEGGLVPGNVMSDDEARRELDKDVYAAIKRQRDLQPGVWTILRAGHKAALVCDARCCWIPVGGTLRNPGRAARDIARRMARHPLDLDDPRARAPRGSTD